MHAHLLCTVRLAVSALQFNNVLRIMQNACCTLQVTHHLMTSQASDSTSIGGDETADAQLSYAVQPLFDEDVDDVVTM